MPFALGLYVCTQALVLFVSVLLVPFRTFITHPKKKRHEKAICEKGGCVCECVNHAGEIDLVGSQRQMNHPHLE